MKAADYGTHTPCTTAFVSTNSICQGEQVPILWPLIFSRGHEIAFAHTSFKWANLASHNAGVTVVIVGISSGVQKSKRLFSVNNQNETSVKDVSQINAYLVAGANIIVESSSTSLAGLPRVVRGNLPNEGGVLLLDRDEVDSIVRNDARIARYIKQFIGAREFTGSTHRYCIWVSDDDVESAQLIPELSRRFREVEAIRSAGGSQARSYKDMPHKFVFSPHTDGMAIAIPAITSENRDYLPVGIVDEATVIGAKCYAIYDAPLWSLALIASRLHWVWIGTVCVRMRTDFSYSNTLGWNTFPTPVLTEQNKTDLTACAEAILLAREANYPATIADLYEVKDGVSKMPDNLRLAHERNDEVLERIYIGRRFKNDTERLEKLFELYTKMTADASGAKKGKKK
jgi:hypothetical protein